MKTLTAHHEERGAAVRTVHHLDDLNFIFDDEVEGVIWNRQAPRSVVSALSALPADDVEDGRFHVALDDVGSSIIGLFRAWKFGPGPAQQWLADDVEALARKVAAILSVSHVRLRVELVRDDACRKFHRDTVRARLICTYSGPGTEFGVASEGDDPQRVDTAPTGSPILLKGKLWPGFLQRLISHRSPPIEGTGVSRLVVVIDEAPSGNL